MASPNGSIKLRLGFLGGKLQLQTGHPDAATVEATETQASEVVQTATPMEVDATESSSVKNVTIAGQSFSSRDALHTHVRTLQESLSDNKPLLNEDALFMFHLSSFLPGFEDKLTDPVVGFTYGPFSESNVLKCFFMLRSDGTKESISVKKCLDGLFATSSPKAAAGTKRPREAEGPAGPEQKKAFKIRPGCVMLISGIPPSVEYKVVKAKLNSMCQEGECRFVELLESKPKKKKKKGKGKDKDKAGKAGDDSDESEDDGTPALPNSARARFGEAEVAARVAKELKEIDGKLVTTRMLDGDEEKDFWEQLLERADKKRGEEASGKKGKGKGKKR